MKWLSKSAQERYGNLPESDQIRIAEEIQAAADWMESRALAEGQKHCEMIGSGVRMAKKAVE